MSGFAAVLALGEPVDADALRDVIAAGAHRGAPDVWTGDGIALVAHGAAIAHRGQLSIAFDGRLDDRLPDAPQRVLAAWERSGERCLDGLTGEFAFALWDGARRTLTCVRDRIGVRPVFVAEQPGRVVVVSEPVQALADPGFRRVADEEWLAGFLTGTSPGIEHTAYRGLRRVGGGYLAEVSARGTTIRRWYDVRNAPHVRERSDDAYAQRLRELLTEAVRCRIAGYSLVGVALSGGVDSSSVACIAGPMLDARGSGLEAFGIPFEDPRADERRYALAAAKRSGARLRWVSLDGYTVFGDPTIRGALAEFGAPFVPPNLFMGMALNDAAAAAGVGVVLDGLDADSVFSGNFEYLSDLLVHGRLGALRAEMRDIVEMYDASARRTLRKFAIGPLVPPPVARAMRRGAGSLRVPEWIAPAWARDRDLAGKVRESKWRPGRAYQASEACMVNGATLSPVLEAEDQLAARRGVRLAHPFLDARVVEFSMGLPREQKIAGGVRKVVLRNAMRGILPEEIRTRRDKADLAPAFEGAFERGRVALAEGLACARGLSGRFFDRDGLDGLISAAVKGDRILEAWRVAFAAQWITEIERSAQHAVSGHRQG